MAKAKALARAWRFVRRLSPSDRKVLAHEAGFDGAEDLLENLATKRGGMAPAMMLQLLGGLRDRGDEGLGLLMACLKDPETRDDILLRGFDAVAEALGPVEGEDPEIQDGPQDSSDAVAVEPESLVTPPPVDPERGPVSEPVVEPIPVAVRGPEFESVATEKTPEVNDDTAEPLQEVTETAPIEAEIEPAELGTIDVAFLVEDLEAETSLVDRLVCLREAVPAIDAGSGDLGRLVGAFPNGWARRRALVALLEAGLPAHIGDALDLIEALERPVDRRWCLGVLIDRGFLGDAEAERALEMVESPTLRRRIVRETGSRL